MAETYKHIFLAGNVNREKYKAPSAMGAKPRIPVRDRVTHSQKLLAQFDVIWEEKERLQQQRGAEQIPTRGGTYISFTSAAGHDLITQSLEDLRKGKGIRLLNIKEVPIGENQTQTRPTVYVPNAKEGLFISKIHAYRTNNNTRIAFPNQTDHDVVSDVINKPGNNFRLKNIKVVAIKGVIITKASIYLPVEQENFFISEILRFFPNTEIRITPSNADLVNSIEDVSIALLEGRWTDKPQLIPTENAKWCEVWLNVNTKENQEQKQIARFLETLERVGIEVKNNSIVFPERAVLLIHANRNNLIELMLQSDLLAEFRAGQEPAGFWVNESSVDQQAWIDNLSKRIQLVESNVKVSLLDSGVNNGHQLLQPLIDDANTVTVDSNWGTNDHSPLRGGHGTLMAGIAGYGELENVLLTGNSVFLSHRLCSVKILPRPLQDETPKELWGDITAQGIAMAEIQNPEMVLIYCMSVTSTDDTDRGRPSSWSGAVDNLAYNDGENQRLIIVSAGNIRESELWQNYPESNFVSSVQNPAQSWNALAVGTYTEKIQVNDDNFSDYTPIANMGELSPFSSTSLKCSCS